MLPEGFVYVRDVIPDIIEDIRYAGCHNFMGCPADGYLAPRAVLRREAALALRDAARAFAAQGYGLLVYDAYRPQRAVDHFVRWAKDERDTKMKAAFYPALDKAELFSRGYIAARSGYSRGMSVDLTLTAQGAPLCMGGVFDGFSPVSAHDYAGLTDAQRANRRLLRTGMEAAGFAAYSREWWHYTLPGAGDVYYDFPIE